jgi:hypothetical protein
MFKNKTVEQRLSQIEARNVRVEAEKAWETSNFRKVLVVITTYFLMCVTMAIIGVNQFYINAIIPTLGYFLSTLSFRFIKKFYVNKKLNIKS